jgi:hypothetical protein
VSRRAGSAAGALRSVPDRTIPASSPPGALRRALSRLRWSFGVDTFDVFVRPVEPAHGRFEPPAGYAFAYASASDVEGCEELHTELDLRERRAGAARLAVGHRCVAARPVSAAGARGPIVFTMWENPRHLNVPGAVKRALASDQVFIYKAFTSPEHRGRGLYEAGMRFVLAEMARRGQRELVGYAHVRKDVSRKGLARLDFASAGRFRVLFAPGVRHTLVSRELRARFPRAAARTRALERIGPEGGT